MKLNNNWNVIGRVYESPTRTLVAPDEYNVRLTLSTPNPFDDSKRMLVPIIVAKFLNDKVCNVCRAGDVIYATGEVVTQEKISPTGTRTLITRFVMSDFYVLSKSKRTKIAEKEFLDLMRVYAPDEYKPKKKE